MRRRDHRRRALAAGGRLLALFALALAGSGCRPSGEGEGAFFRDVTAGSGIDFKVANGAAGERLVEESMVGGVGWIDYDGDGDYDLFLVNGHSDSLHPELEGKESDRLYQNDGGGHFSDVTAQAGVGDRRYGFGVAVGDFDNDGDSDLLVTNFGRNTLYRNGGDRTFADVTLSAGLREEGWSASAVWFDMDRDGDLDLYIARYLKYNPRTSRRCREQGVPVHCNPRLFPGEPDLLYRNLGDGRFEEIGQKAGIARAGDHEGKGLGVVSADFDRDGLQDIYVANDTTPNFLWHNNGDSTFTDLGQERGAALSAEGKPQAGMGVDLGDVNGDGFTDLYVTNFAFELNSLYLGGKGGQFQEESRRRNLGATYQPLGFGTLFIDLDLDGDQDIVTLNGHISDVVETTDRGSGSTYLQRPALFLNDGRGVFEDGASRGGGFFSTPAVGRGLARADFDGDGDVDLAAVTLDRGLVLLRNENPQRRPSATIRLIGTRSPRDGYGSRVEAEVGGRLQTFEYQSARSYLSASDPRVVVALGAASRIDRLTIHWTSGQVQELRELKPQRLLTIREPE
jgi:hypothetical protein